MEKPNEKLKKKAALNSVSSFLDYSVKLLVYLFVNPYIIRGLGINSYGIWETISQISNYTKTADFKATEALKWKIAREKGFQNDLILQKYLTSALYGFLILIPLFSGLGFLLILNIDYLIKLDSSQVKEVQNALAFLIFAIIILKFFDLHESVLRGMNLGYKRMGIRAFIYILGAGAQISVILFGFGITGLAFVNVLINILSGFVLVFLIKKHVPWFKFKIIRIRDSFDFLKLSGWFSVWTLVYLLINSSDKVALSYFMDPENVGIYSIFLYSSFASKGILFNIISGVAPGFGQFFADKNLLKINEIRLILYKLILGFCIVFGVIIILLNQSFVNLWISDHFTLIPLINYLLVIIMALDSFIYLENVLLNLSLKVKFKVVSGLISFFISFFVWWLLIEDYGILGLCLGIVFGRIFLLASYIYYVNIKIVENKAFQIPFDLPFLILGFMLLGVAYSISGLVQIQKWSSLIGFAFLGILIIGSILFSILRKTEKQLIINSIKSIIKR